MIIFRGFLFLFWMKKERHNDYDKQLYHNPGYCSVFYFFVVQVGGSYVTQVMFEI